MAHPAAVTRLQAGRTGRRPRRSRYGRTRRAPRPGCLAPVATARSALPITMTRGGLDGPAE
jgi:hypothetical protein